MSARPILAIGSTGKTGRRIFSRLTDQGHQVRQAGRRTDPPFSWEQPSAVAADEFRAALTEYADLLTHLCEEVFDGRNATLARGLQDALGREPRDFAGFCRSTAASGVWQR